jgi:hypothetical protein
MKETVLQDTAKVVRDTVDTVAVGGHQSGVLVAVVIAVIVIAVFAGTWFYFKPNGTGSTDDGL